MTSSADFAWQPRYVSGFVCDGSKCNALCCRAWDIAIDDGTYEKYRQLEDPADKKFILDNIKNLAGGSGRLIKMDQARICPFLCNDLLCHIQRNYGAEALSQTCRSFPRHLVQLYSFQLRSLSMVCPVAAGLALLSAGAMTMEPVDRSGEDTGWESLNFESNEKSEALSRLIEEIILGGISILQDKTYTRGQRLFILGLYLDRADELLKQENAIELVADLTKTYQTEGFRQQLRPVFGAFAFDGEGHAAFMQELINGLTDKDILPDSALPKDFPKLPAYGPADPSPLNSTGGNMLDNFLVQEFIHHGYPFRVDDTLMHNYLIFLQSWALWRYWLFHAHRKSGGSLSPREFIRTAGEYCKVADHTKGYAEVLSQLAEKYRDTPMALIQRLIRL